MDNTTDKKSPQQIKADKIRANIGQITGISFGDDPFGTAMAGVVHDAIRTGARKVNQDEEDAPIHCNAEWHFARYSGAGSTLVGAIYGISWHLAKDSGSFYLSKLQMATFLDKRADDITAAASLLEADGFWRVIEREAGKPVKYQPVKHTDWALAHPDRCTKKIEIEWVQDDPDLAKLGRDLGAILGGEKFYKEILIGVRNAAPEGSTNEEICRHGKNFLATDKGNGGGIERRKRFLEYLRELDGTDSY